jgi:hypothetical protein
MVLVLLLLLLEHLLTLELLTQSRGKSTDTVGSSAAVVAVKVEVVVGTS